MNVVESIVALAEARTETLREIQELRAEAVSFLAERRRELTDHHNRANRVLVQAIEAAVKKGLNRTEILARTNISRDRYYQIKNKVAARDHELRRQKACEQIETPQS